MIDWVGKIQKIQPPVLFEGQARIAFITEALRLAPVPDAKIILVDCDDKTRTDRLCNLRKQPELANQQMMDWAESLRQEALQAGVQILDTSKQSVEQCVDVIVAKLLELGYVLPHGHIAE